MENKINIAELLKDCPKGTKLYSPLVGDGTYFQIDNSECLLFPSKDQRDWSKFQRPFKDGDIVAYDCTDEGTQLYIFKEQNEVNSCCTCYLMLDCYGELDLDKGRYYITRLATEEEKEKLFDAIKANGYKWNSETKTLEKLPKFKIGDKIKKKGNNDYRLTTIESINNNYYVIKTPDWFDNRYTTDKLYFSNQDNYELVPSKFDISTLIPFESRVLVRSNDVYYWKPAIFGFYDKVNFYMLGGSVWKYCIPYKGNEHLLGTADDCDEFYKTW